MLIGHLQPLRVVKQSCGIGQTAKRWITPHAEIHPAIAFAYDAVDYAESAVLDAIVARADADAVQ